MIKIRLISVLIIAVMLVLPISVCAEIEEVEPRASFYFNSYSVTFSQKGDGKLGITIKCTGVETSEKLGVEDFLIQKKVDNDWYGVGSWVEGQISENTASHMESYNFNGVIGTTYRLKVRLYCKNSYGVGRKTFYSPTITAKA